MRCWRARNRERDRANCRAWTEKNSEKKKQSSRGSYLRNKEKILERSRQWQLENPEKVKKSAREYLDRNPGKMGAWAKADPERWRAYKREYESKRLQDPKNRMSNAIRAAIWRTLAAGQKTGGRTFALLGYSKEELSRHLERQFSAGMSWENYGYGDGRWHIDHILPLASFSFQSVGEPEFRAAWALSNLRPMWGVENIRKGSKRVSLL